jgi:predicted ferric reductase
MSWAYSESSVGEFLPHPRLDSYRGKGRVDLLAGIGSEVPIRSRLDLLAFGIPAAVCGVLSILFLNIRCCRFSSLGICCLRRKVGKLRKRNWCDELTFDVVPAISDMTWGEFFIASMYLASVLLYLAAAAVTFAEAERDYVFVAGQLTAIHMALTLLPTARTSFWTGIFGISFERAIKWHRWVARVTVAIMSAHGITMLQRFTTDEILGSRSTEKTAEGLGNLWGFLTWICVGIMFLFAYEPIRRKTFEMFYYTHYLFILAYIFACLHSSTCFWLSVGPMILYGFDRVVRFVRSRRIVKVLDAKVFDRPGGERITNLELSIPGFHFSGGDYCFLNVPALGLMQWHPFSISSFPNQAGDPFTFHILDMGPGSWTHALSTRAADLKSGKIPIYVDGPYGSLSLNPFDYPYVVLCCGGVGATPMMGVLGDLYNRWRQQRLKHIKGIHLYWVNSNEHPIQNWFTGLLATLQKAGPPFMLHTYATGNAKKGKPGAKDVEMAENKNDSKADTQFLPPITAGRPNYDKEFAAIPATDPADVCMLTCGPLPMVAACQDAAIKRNWHMHKETFFF